MNDDDDLLIVEEPDLQEMLDRLEQIKEQRAALDNEATVLTFNIEARVKRSALYAGSDGQTWRATVVRGSSTKVDLGWFKRNAPEVFEAITKPAIDNDALRRLLRSGRITREMAQAAITVSDNKPSVKFTVAGHEEDGTTHD